MSDKIDLVGAREAGLMLGISVQGVHHAVRKGKLIPFKVTPTGRRQVFFKPADILKYKAARAAVRQVDRVLTEAAR